MMCYAFYVFVLACSNFIARKFNFYYLVLFPSIVLDNGEHYILNSDVTLASVFVCVVIFHDLVMAWDLIGKTFFIMFCRKIL